MQTHFFLHIDMQLNYCFYDRMRPHAIAYKKKKKTKKKNKTKKNTLYFACKTKAFYGRMRSHTRRKRRRKRKRKRRRKQRRKRTLLLSARLPSGSKRRLKRKADHHQTVCLAIVCFMKMNVPLRALHFTEVWKNHQTDPKAQCLCGV